MQNSKGFSTDSSQASLLTKRQFDQCLFHFNAWEKFELTTVNLTHLQKELANGGEQLVAPKYLIAEELKRYFSFRHPKRRIEWLGGRIAAKLAAHRLTANSTAKKQLPWRQWRVEADKHGRPLLIAQSPLPQPIPDISISHSGNQAAAMASLNRICGLDIQQISPTVSRVQSRFSSPEETTLISANPSLQEFSLDARLTLLWTAKEAIRKAIACQPLLGFQELRLIAFAGESKHGFKGDFVYSRMARQQQIPVFHTLDHTMAAAVTLVAP